MADDKKKPEAKPRDIKAEIKAIPPLIDDTKKAIKVIEALQKKMGGAPALQGALNVLHNARKDLIIKKADLEDL